MVVYKRKKRKLKVKEIKMSACDNGIRLIEKEESLTEYVSWMMDIQAAKGWTGAIAMGLFKAGTRKRNGAADVANQVMEREEPREGYLATLLQELRTVERPQRDTNMVELFRMRLKPGQDPKELADKMTKIIERVYSRRPSRENILRDLYLCALGERYLKPIMAAPVKPATMEELKVMVDGMRVSEDPERFGRKVRLG